MTAEQATIIIELLEKISFIMEQFATVAYVMIACLVATIVLYFIYLVIRF